MAVVAGAVVAGAAAAAILALTTTSPSSSDRRGGGTASVVTWAVPAQECAVCLSELAGAAGCSGGTDEPAAAAATVRTLPGCGHGFHEECIARWLPLRPECPLCRRHVAAEVAADGGTDTRAVAVAAAEAAPAWSRPARIACGFGDGRVVWTRSPSVQEL